MAIIGAAHNPNFSSKVDKAEMEFEKLQCEEVNKMTLDKFLPLWLGNLAENIPIVRGKKSIKDLVPEYAPAIIVGGSPFLTDEQIDALKDFKGRIIACQKPLKRLLERGVVPQWVVAIDGDPIMREQLLPHAIIKDKAKEINAYICAECDPECVKFFEENFKEKYYFVANIPEEHLPKGSSIMAYLAKLNHGYHGGNAGSTAFLLARTLKCNPIGMLGMEMCFKPDPKWTKQQAGLYQYIFDPEKNEFMAFIPAFQTYITQQLGFMDKAKEVGIDTYSLMPSGIWSSGKVPQMHVNEFIKKFNK